MVIPYLANGGHVRLSFSEQGHEAISTVYKNKNSGFIAKIIQFLVFSNNKPKKDTQSHLFLYLTRLNVCVCTYTHNTQIKNCFVRT